MKHRSRGFTLIELVAAITVAGAASAVALPPLIDLQGQAESTTLASLASAAGSAMAINYAGCLVTGQAVQAGKCVAIGNCADVGALLLVGVPAGYRVADQPLGAGSTHGAEARCALAQENNGAEALFYGISAGR